MSCVSDSSIKKIDNEFINNSFDTQIINNSVFDIEINLEKIKSKTTKLINLSVHEMQLYDGLSINYKIPLSEKVYIMLKQKCDYIDFQEEIQIEDPVKNNTKYGTFIQIRNDSNQTIQFQDSTSLIGFLLEGNVDNVDAKYEFSLSPKTVGVIEVKNLSELKVLRDSKNIGMKIANVKKLFPNYLYSFTYDGTRIYQTDVRPIWKINEPSWKLPIPEIFTPYHILTDFTTERYILVGTEDECGKLVVLESDGNTSWIKNYESGKSYFLSADVNSKGDILVGGQLADYGFLMLYDKDGAELSDVVRFIESNAIWKIKNVSENLFYVNGFYEDRDAFCWLVKTNGNKIQIAKEIKLPIPEGWFGSNFALYAKNNDCILAVNSADSNNRELTQLYKIDFENELYTEINLNQKINYISGICVVGNNQIFVSGDTQNSLGIISASILKIESDSIETFYTAPETNSSFSSMYYSEDLQELVCSGFVNSNDTMGTAGTPIVRGVSLQNAKVSWENKFDSGEYNVSDLFCPALDYGYLISNSSVYTNGKHESEILRVNSNGTLSENYIAIKFEE